MDQTPASDASVIFDATSIGAWDNILLALIIGAAMGYLYIKLWRNKGACTSCPSSGPGCSGCQVGNIEFDTKTPLKNESSNKA